MSRVRTMRWLRSCLVGLFALAQIAGVSTLICDHTLNVYETTPVLSHHHLRTTIAAPDANHHHGIIDLHDQCCALHSLAGPLPLSATAVLVVSVGVQFAPSETVALNDQSPSRLDPPPKPLPLI